MFAQNSLTNETAKLQKFALRLTKNKADADDLLQSTCLRALEKADKFETGTNLFSWTSKIMFNIFISNYRRKAKFETKYDPEPILNKQTMEPTQQIQAEFSSVTRSMMKLGAVHRQILVMICIKGMSYEEVSRQLHVPVGTIRSRLSRARKQLQFIMDTPTPRMVMAAREPVNANMPTMPAYIASHAMRRNATGSRER